MANDLERMAVEIERPIGCISRTVFWILFVIFGAVLGVIGWFLYTSVIVHHPLPGDTSQKDAAIIILSGIVLAMALAAIVRDTMRGAIYRRILRRRSKG